MNLKWIVLCSFVFLSDPGFSLMLSKEKCGEYLFKVEVLNESDFYDREFRLYYQKEGGKEVLFYKTNAARFLDAACIKDIKNKQYLLTQQTCGGSGCPEDVYGLFDLDKNKLLINPDEVTWAVDLPIGNSKVIKKIIGYDPPYSSGKGTAFFCCDKQMKKFNTAIN